MAILKVSGYIILMAMFLNALFVIFKFQFGSEGKDERGQKILNFAYTAAFPIIPIGWLLITLYDDYIQGIDFDLYKWLIWILVVTAFIVQGATIFILKRKW